MRPPLTRYYYLALSVLAATIAGFLIVYFCLLLRP